VRSAAADRTLPTALDEAFDLVVDDPREQRLTLIVKDDDHGWTDPAIGVLELPLQAAAFVRWAAGGRAAGS
jgi:hypothetical protein